MTQEIIEMARQAGFDWSGKDLTFECFICTEELEAFAKLVAEKEREAWSKVCEDIRKVFNEKADLAYIAGQKEEREACAKYVEEYETDNDITATWLNIIADAIRAREQP